MMKKLKLNVLFFAIQYEYLLQCVLSQNQSFNVHTILTPTKVMKARNAGSTSFITILNGGQFVDKTELIAEYFSEMSQETAVFISAPRRHGKSVNLNMFETFVSLDEGKTNWKYEIFKNLKIGQHKDIMKKHLGIYPTMKIDFSNTAEDTKALTLDNLLSRVEDMLSRFSHIFELINSPEYDPKRKVLLKVQILVIRRILENKYYQIVDKEDRAIVMESDIKKSLYYCAKILFYHFNHTPVVLLVDELDSILMNGVTKYKWNLKMLSHFGGLIQTMLANLVKTGNEHINNSTNRNINSTGYMAYGYFTGILPMTLNFHASGLNNVRSIKFLDPDNEQFHPYFGLTETEVDDLFKKLQKPHHNRELARKFYDGYSDQTGISKMCNTESILQYLVGKKSTPKQWWPNTGVFSELFTFLQFDAVRNFIYLILQNEIIIRDPVYKNFEHADLEQIVTLMHKPSMNFNTGSTVSVFARLMYHYGYATYCGNGDAMCLRVPNGEISQSMVKEFENFLDKNGIHLKAIGDSLYNFVHDEQCPDKKTIDEFRDGTENAFINFYHLYEDKKFKKAYTRPEADYQSLLDMAALKFSEFLDDEDFLEKPANKKSKQTRTNAPKIDLLLKDKGHKTALVIETKRYLKSDSERKSAFTRLKEVLKQAKNYTVKDEAFNKYRYMAVYVDQNINVLVAFECENAEPIYSHIQDE